MKTRHPSLVFTVALIIGALTLVFGLAACGSSGSSSSSTNGTGASEGEEGTEPTGESGSGNAELTKAEKQLEEAYAGRYTEPPTASNPAAKGKTVWFISPGQASPNAAYGWKAFEEATKAIGWTPKLYDAKLEPANFAIGIRQAIAAGAEGILTFGIDCSLIKAPLEEAKKAEIPTITELGLDCDETSPGEEALYTAPISLGNRYENWAAAYHAWGSDMAAWTIAETEGNANVLNFNNTEYTIISNTVEGFSERMKECSTCKVTDQQWVLAEAGTETSNKVKTLLVKEPETNVVQDALNPLLGFTTGVVQAGKTSEVKVVGGLGLPEDFETISEGNGLTAVAAWPFTWWSWAAVDTLNSLFNGSEPEDSGLGWQMVDSENNLPAEGTLEPSVDFKSVYLKRWGKS